MNTARAGHTATLLPTGNVLIAGGARRDPSAELYDPSTGTFTTTGNMTTARWYSHTATLLANGQVLIAGGIDGSEQPLASAELYEPSTGMFAPTGSMTTAEVWRPATLLGNGKVFVAGATNAEIYDPDTGTFALTASYAHQPPVGWLTATMLLDGRVLLTGCWNCFVTNVGVAELFDPLAGTFSVTGPPHGTDVAVSTATLLMDGTVLLVQSIEVDVGPYRDEVEVYDRTTGTFTFIGNTIAPPHEFSGVARLADGTVLITGGQLNGGNGQSATELYLPDIGMFAFAGNMTTGRHSHTATLLPDGTVLLVGGFSTWPSPTSSAEIYRPPAP